MTTEITTNGGFNAVIAAAVEKGGDIAVVERMMALQMQVMAKQAEIEFNQSFSEMVHKIPVIAKTKKAHTTTYAPLEDIVEVVRPILSAHGFSISFRTIQPDLDQMTVVCELRHRAGHSTNNSITLPVKAVNNGMNPMQAVGAAMSYGKRYALCAMLNIATADDNNGFAVNAKQIKPTLSDARFQGALEAIKAGKAKAADLIKKFDLTDQQMEILTGGNNA